MLKQLDWMAVEVSAIENDKVGPVVTNIINVDSLSFPEVDQAGTDFLCLVQSFFEFDYGFNKPLKHPFGWIGRRKRRHGRPEIHQSVGSFGNLMAQ